MSDLNPNNPENDPGSNNFENPEYELISAYIDNEIKDDLEKKRIQELIETDNNFRNRFIFEKLTKEKFNQGVKKIETPVYVYKKIGEGINEYIKKSSNPVSKFSADIYSSQINFQKSNLKRNLIYSSVAFIFLILAAFGLNSFLNKNPEIRENDLVAVSRSIFDKVSSGQIKPQVQSSNAKELADSMNKYLDFKVYIPDVKEAVLIGGVCNEINGEKLAHIIHKKGNVIIYTLQASKLHVLTNKDRIILCDEFKDNVNNGKNWFPCRNDKTRTAVIWFKDNVICSTISTIEPEEITSTLTNFK